ncbi:hypothetical protein LSAT2_014893 [Lamellibrachia satsuma]|nr:hypothetical protein LSAT2_014893 [Lamellibrachia satsuma]
MKLNIIVFLLAATLLARSCSGGRPRDRPSSGTRMFRVCLEHCEAIFNTCIQKCSDKNIDKCKQKEERCKKKCKKMFKVGRAKDRRRS